MNKRQVVRQVGDAGIALGEAGSNAQGALLCFIASMLASDSDKKLEKLSGYAQALTLNAQADPEKTEAAAKEALGAAASTYAELECAEEAFTLYALLSLVSSRDKVRLRKVGEYALEVSGEKFGINPFR